LVRENSRERFIFKSGRTHNRIRSPRLVASCQEYTASEGYRQNRSVTLGKGLALKIELLESFGGLSNEFHDYAS